jgi:hypothetical protein
MPRVPAALVAASGRASTGAGGGDGERAGWRARRERREGVPRALREAASRAGVGELGARRVGDGRKGGFVPLVRMLKSPAVG